MKILIAPDSFKGSIGAKQAALAIEAGLGRAGIAATVCLPVADGGEGTLDALVPQDARVRVTVTGPLHRPVEAEYGYLGDTAIVEMATAAGLTLLSEDERNAGKTTTLGVGELLLHALQNGAKRLLLTVGGSATNDGGCGMLTALGAVFYDETGEPFLPTGESLARIARIDLDAVANRLLGVEIEIATDVRNPLLGEQGATLVYGRQKGADDASLAIMEKGMTHYVSLLERISGRRVRDIPGCGAGGGIASGLLALGCARVRRGIDCVLDACDFDTALQDAALVITGEGSMDSQSLNGKVISGVASRARERGVPVICLVGRDSTKPEDRASLGIEGVLSISPLARDLADSMQNADAYLRLLAEWLGIERLGAGKGMPSSAQVDPATDATWPLEIERKYLVDYPDLDAIEALDTCDKIEIQQTYLTPKDGWERRVRRWESQGRVRYHQTEKKKRGELSRYERENEISERDYRSLLKEADPRMGTLFKTRYRVSGERHLYELDVYPFLRDRAILEIELEREDQPIDLPPWLSVRREVSGEKAYKNKHLAAFFGVRGQEGD